MIAPGEADILRRCRKGDENAWNELFERHYAATGRFVHQLSADLTPEDVEEICQETFLTVIRSIFSFQGQSQFQTWLFRIAANKAHDHLDRQRAAKRGGGQVMISLQAEDGDGLTLDPPADGPGPDLALINDETMKLVAQAVDEGYPGASAAGKALPYQGYYFRILKGQGPSAPGGRKTYISGTQMAGGYALLAWPAVYGSSGITSFMVNKDGIVFQKDLGPDTSKIAAGISLYDPDITWARVDITP